jgi:hypothetical protein
MAVLKIVLTAVLTTILIVVLIAVLIRIAFLLASTCGRLLDGCIFPPCKSDPTEIPRERLRRAEAADYARRRLGQSVKVNTLRSWPISYRQIGRDAVYELADLDRFIDERLAAAPRRGPAPDFAGMYRERLRLSGLDAHQAESKLRALEHVVGACCRHYGCSLEAAKRMVTSAIAAREAARKAERESLK